MKYWKKKQIYKKRDLKYFKYLENTDFIVKLGEDKYAIVKEDEEITEYLITIFTEKTKQVDVEIKYKEYLKIIKEYNKIRDVAYDLIEIYANMENITIKEAEKEFLD